MTPTARCYGVQMAFRILLLALLLVPNAVPAQPPADSFSAAWARAGMLVSLAPACGWHDEEWAGALARRVASAQQGDVTAEAQRDGMAAAALSVQLGPLLFARFGRALCIEDRAHPPWLDAAALPPAREDTARLPELSSGLVRLGWQAVVGTLALRCDLRDQRWAQSAGPALRRAIRLHGGLEGDAAVRARVSLALLDQAGFIATTLRGIMLGDAACAGLRGDRDLAAVDAMAVEWRRMCGARRVDPSCL